MPKPRMPVEREFQTQISKRPDAIRKSKEIFIGKRKAQVANGRVYIGYVNFENAGKKRVIIKEVNLDHFSKNRRFSETFKFFKDLKFELTPELFAEVYNQTIIDLRNAGLNLPKMFAVVRDGKVLIISQHFGNAVEKSKFTKFKLFRELSEVELKDLLDIWEKVLNANYIPSADLSEHFNDSFIPFDLDIQVLVRLQFMALRNANINFDPKKLFAEAFYQKYMQLTRIYSITNFESFFIELLSRIKDPELVREILMLRMQGYGESQK